MAKRPASTEERPPLKFQRVDKKHPFLKLRSLPSAFDIVFRVGDERLAAHRIVLVAASPYFENLLPNGMKESSQAEVKQAQFGARSWGAVLDFICGAEVNFTYAEMPEVLELLECAQYC